jgi:hypothetical protein
MERLRNEILIWIEEGVWRFVIFVVVVIEVGVGAN